MTTTKPTAGDYILQQHSAIQSAIGLLTADLDEMTDEINPATASWRDVSRFAHVADLAKRIIQEYEERA